MYVTALPVDQPAVDKQAVEVKDTQSLVEKDQKLEKKQVGEVDDNNAAKVEVQSVEEKE